MLTLLICVLVLGVVIMHVQCFVQLMCLHVMGGWHNFLILIKYTLIMFAKLYDSDLLSIS